MHNSLPLISTLTMALVLALLLGFIAIRFKFPTILGYLLAGILIGPFTPGFVANSQIASELAEIGVMLLMFGVGLHFSLEDLVKCSKIALPGACIQIFIATAMGVGVAYFWGWSLASSLVFGLALSVASTVVLIRALELEGLLRTMNGQIAVGWLIVEDLVMVLVLVFLPLFSEWVGVKPLSEDKNLWVELGISFFEISSFILIMLIFGRWVIPKLLWHIARTGSRELFTLFIIAAAMGIAFGASRLFGLSFALGAFFAGMIIRESKFSRRAAEESLPFRDAFAVLFFVSVGMLFNPGIILNKPLAVLAVLAIIIVGKYLASALIVLLFRYPLPTALIVSASLAQIGEFSFILAGLGVKLKLLSREGMDLIITGAIISIAINPLLFRLIRPLYGLITTDSTLSAFSQLPVGTDEKFLSGQVVLIGYGRIGKRISRMLSKEGLPHVIVDEDYELIKKLRSRKKAAVHGNATHASVLIQSHIKKAGIVVITLSDIFTIRTILTLSRKLNSTISVAVRSENEETARLLNQENNIRLFFHETELAKGMTGYILKRYGMQNEK